jgi:hypothetical protein
MGPKRAAGAWEFVLGRFFRVQKAWCGARGPWSHAPERSALVEGDQRRSSQQGQAAVEAECASPWRHVASAESVGAGRNDGCLPGEVQRDGTLALVLHSLPLEAD